MGAIKYKPIVGFALTAKIRNYFDIFTIDERNKSNFY